MMDSMRTGRTYDRRDLGARVLEYLAAKMDHAMATRATIDESRIIDIAYTDFISDGVATVRDIYDHFGMMMTPELESEMATYSDRHPQAEFGRHEYDLADYGLTPAAIHDRFAGYLDGFSSFTR